MTMYTLMSARGTRRFVDVQQAGRLEEIARRGYAGQTVTDNGQSVTTNQHTR